jgi:hypothetical protein
LCAAPGDDLSHKRLGFTFDAIAAFALGCVINAGGGVGLPSRQPMTCVHFMSAHAGEAGNLRFCLKACAAFAAARYHKCSAAILELRLIWAAKAI